MSTIARGFRNGCTAVDDPEWRFAAQALLLVADRCVRKSVSAEASL